jgi:hypothetical protein
MNQFDLIRRDQLLEAVDSELQRCESDYVHMGMVEIRKHIENAPAYDPRRPPSERPDGENCVVFMIHEERSSEEIKMVFNPLLKEDRFGDMTLCYHTGDYICDWSDVLWWQPINTEPMKGGA